MKKGLKRLLRLTIIIALTAVISVRVSLSVYADDTAGSAGDRGNIRIGYCQYGDYYEFDYELFHIGAALLDSGQIECDRLSSLTQGATADEVWKALTSAKSDSFTFVKDGYFDIAAGEFAELTPEESGRLLGSKIAGRDIDLMITMGTYSGQAVRDYSDVPYMNFITSDPIGSEITYGEEYSGSDRAWAHVNAGVDEKALTVMYDIFNPSKLGIVYNNTDEAYIYSGAQSVDSFSKENGISVVREYVNDDFGDSREAYEQYKRNLRKAHEKLAKSGIDMYILTPSMLNPEDFRESLEPLIYNGIPVFSINSTEDVRFGALAAVEMLDYENIGRFAADNLKAYHAGAKLSELNQIYATAPYLVLNIDTLRDTGLKMSLDELLSASKIYSDYREK